MEQEKIIPEQQLQQLWQRFDRLVSEKLKIKELSALPKSLPEEKDDIPDVRRWR